MTNKKQHTLGTLLGFIYIGLQSLTSIIYIPILIGGMGDGEYGLYQIMGSVIAYFAVMESPMSASIMRFYSEHLVRGETEKAENTLAIGRRIFRIMSAVILAVAVPVAFIIRSVYASSFTSSEMTEALIMFAIMIVNSIITFNNFTYTAAIYAHEHFIFYKTVSIVTQILQPLCVFLIISSYPYAVVIVLVQLSLTVLSTTARMIYAKKKLKIKIKYHGKDPTLLKKMLSLSLSILFVALADQIFWKTDQLIIGWKFGTAMTAVYSVGAQLNTMYIQLGCVIPEFVIPSLARIVSGENSDKKLSSFFAKIGRLQAFVCLLIISGVVLFGKEFVYMLAGDGYNEAYYIAMLLMLPYTVDLIQCCGNSILQMKNMYRYKAIVLSSVAVLNVILTFILIEPLGMAGAAIATLISIILGPCITMNIIYQKKVELDIIGFWKKVMPIVLLSVPIAALGYFITKISLPNIYLQFALHVALYCILYASVMFALAANREEKSFVFDKIKKLLSH